MPKLFLHSKIGMQFSNYVRNTRMRDLLGPMKGEEGTTTTLFLDTSKLKFKLPRCLHLYVCVYPSVIYLFIHLSIHPSVQPSTLHPSNYHLSPSIHHLSLSIHPAITSLSIHLHIPDGIPPYSVLLRKSQLCLNSHSLGGDWRPKASGSIPLLWDHGKALWSKPGS